ncbi:uncharacterized protein Bfra_001805 [Botrytis fragariae]|uniref:Uncharacterized protein n=1 Tax=Botrytis fragariae TaxID=1964551 RepID=A0A8H6B1J2_9HELO|nr:uncharacterized protein Bfra_001805 [Botrytis fragariae]KAF5877438.1 hypothetical protein Bfra_001805 [Botrytis fragariae]
MKPGDSARNTLSVPDIIKFSYAMSVHRSISVAYCCGLPGRMAMICSILRASLSLESHVKRSNA